MNFTKVKKKKKNSKDLTKINRKLVKKIREAADKVVIDYGGALKELGKE